MDSSSSSFPVSIPVACVLLLFPLGAEYISLALGLGGVTGLLWPVGYDPMHLHD